MNLSLFDQVEQKKQEAVEAAYEFASLDWKQIAHDSVQRCAVEMPEFSTNDVWDKINATGVTTRTNRALGAVMQAAAKDGVIKRVGYTPSNRAHNSPISLWQSLIYRSNVGPR